MAARLGEPSVLEAVVVEVEGGFGGEDEVVGLGTAEDLSATAKTPRVMDNGRVGCLQARCVSHALPPSTEGNSRDRSPSHHHYNITNAPRSEPPVRIPDKWELIASPDVIMRVLGDPPLQAMARLAVLDPHFQSSEETAEG
jgi:hypothetical protein